MAKKKKDIKTSLKKFTKLIEKLRSVNGCPWDKEQTHKSLKNCLVEETYEVIEAINEDNPYKLKEELGDLLLQVVFHAQIASENKQFNIDDIIKTVSEKIIRRHPHVFSSASFKNTEEVLINWEKIKQQEKKQLGTASSSILDGIPKQIPSLLRAHRVQERVARVGFDWNHINDVYKKLDEELGEFKEAIQKKEEKAILEELGDVFFTLVNISRFLETDPEEALQATINKFIDRFKYIEKEISNKNKSFDDYNLTELEKLWEKAKKKNLAPR